MKKAITKKQARQLKRWIVDAFAEASRCQYEAMMNGNNGETEAEKVKRTGRY